MTQGPPTAGAARDRWSSSVQKFLDDHQDQQTLPSGRVVEDFLSTHSNYLDERIGSGDISDLGPSRSAAGHIEEAIRRWDTAISPVLTGRRVILALAMDPGVGWPLLQSGVIALLLQLWRRRIRTGEEPNRVVWDLLSDHGRELVVNQPLLAAALGAPAEWSVSLPAEASALAWASSGEQLAFLADGVVYRAARGEANQRVSDVEGQVLSLSWGSQGVLALRLEAGDAALIQVADGKHLGDWPRVSDGQLSGDGSTAWLETADGLLSWRPGATSPAPLGPSTRPIAVDWTGREGMVGWKDHSLLLSTVPGASFVSGQAPKDWPSESATVVASGDPEATMVVSGSPEDQPCALVRLERTALATTDADGNLEVTYLPFPPVARIAAGPGGVTALATDPSGTRLAVAMGREIRVWPLQHEPPTADPIPAYDSDRVGAVDLLGSDRDARALAALIASRDLKPPLAIGLFGAWGSGKSFVLKGIEDALEQIKGQGAIEGYLQSIRVVSFNAWQYAEINLWASLVDEVLRKIGPVGPIQPSPEVQQIETLAEQAERRAQDAAAALAEADRQLLEARRRLVRQRRLALALGAGLAVVGAAVVAVLWLGASAKLVAGYGAALALISSASAFVAQLRQAGTEAAGLRQTGQDAVAALTRLAGRQDAQQVGEATHTLVARRHDYDVAQGRAARLRADADRMREVSESQRLGAVLQRMASLTEYRDQLSLVTRTRERFQAIDAAVTRERNRRDGQAAGESSEDRPTFQRVVVMIDDLDRCPPEKVVTVLEAVHLLFDFEMFVVVIAVDTRWLDQSLRIHYRRLLGKRGGAAPSDYLEKIIQVPLHLPPLDERLVRGMIAGLATPASDGTPGEAAEGKSSNLHVGGGGQTGTAAGPAARRLVATKARPSRPPLPAKVLQITQEEATAMSVVAPLVGTTPRTVKRFVNTYRLLKARAAEPSRFDEPQEGIGDHAVVAFLLAIVTGHADLATYLLPALAEHRPEGNLQAALGALDLPDPPTPQIRDSLAAVRAWIGAHQSYADAPVQRFAAWATEVARFSFTAAPPVFDADRQVEAADQQETPS